WRCSAVTFAGRLPATAGWSRPWIGPHSHCAAMCGYCAWRGRWLTSAPRKNPIKTTSTRPCSCASPGDEGARPMNTPQQAHWAPPQLRQQRCELSRLIEPGDLLGPTAVAALGPARTHELIFSGRSPTSEEQQTVAAAAQEAGLNTSRITLAGGLERWRTRTEQAAGERDLRVL